MSLDVYLILEDAELGYNISSGIFVREDGQIREITRTEWDARFPGREPVIADTQTNEVYWANITHNLNRMAAEAGIYEYLWRPDEIDISEASQLIDPLLEGLALLVSDPDRFREFNPKNGWGDYEGLIRFVQDYLAACRQYPNAKIEVSR